MLEKIKAEITASGISPEVAELNIRLVCDIEVDPVTRDVTTPIADALNRTFTRFGHQMKPTEMAALFVSEDGECWQAKVFKLQQENNGRTGQYIAPTGNGDIPYLPSVPEETAKTIAFRHGLSSPTGSFWEWVKENPEVPIVVTEGAKKALALISIGIPAIALYGCMCGRCGDLGIKASLRPWVEGREVIIAFDQDSKPSTITKVRKATRALCRMLDKICTPKVAVWSPAAGKGIDDVLAINPAAGVNAIASAMPLAKYRLYADQDLSGLNPVEIYEPFLKDFQIPDNKRLVCLKSRKKTGKTELLSRLVAEAPAGTRVLVFSHREQLAKALAGRFKLEYRTEISREGWQYGYGLCVDSAHPEASPPLDPADWENSWLIFDECEQVFWHLLNSETCKFKRMAILSTLTQLVQSADRIFLADADLTRVSIDYVNGMLEAPHTPYVLINRYEHIEERQLFTFNKPEELLAEIIESANRGNKLLIHTGSQQAKSKWGTITLESLLRGTFPQKKILRIDSATVAEVGHEACGCIEGVDQVFPLYDIVIASPTIETGISIECNHFDGVFCFATGSQTVDAIAQTLERERSNVPRYLWAQTNANWNRIGSGAIDAFGVLSDSKKLNRVNAFFAKLDTLSEMEGESRQVNQETWAKIAAHHNNGFMAYRTAIYDKVAEDFEVIEWEWDKTTEELRDVKEMAKLTAETNHDEYCDRVAKAEILTDAELAKLEKKRAKTEKERLSEKKTKMAKKYRTPKIDPGLVDKDSDGWYRKIMIQYYLTEGAEFLVERDQAKVRKLAEKTGAAFVPDINRACFSATVKTFARFNIQQFLVPSKRQLSNQSLAEWLEEIKPYAQDLKRLARITITEKTTPIQALSRILNRMGLKLESVKRSRKHDLCRLYVVQGLKDGRKEVFARITEEYRCAQMEQVAA